MICETGGDEIDYHPSLSLFKQITKRLEDLEVPAVLYSQEYKKHCALTAVISPDGAQTSYVYDNRKFLIVQRDETNNLIYYQYNELG